MTAALLRIWGILSREDETAGFDVILDEDWSVLLTHNNLPIDRFDPHNYTLTELKREIRELIRALHENTAAA